MVIQQQLGLTLISPTTRHLIHFGTETTIGDPTTQDDMFIRFSDQESINDYTPTAVTRQVRKGYKMAQKLWVARLLKKIF